MKHPTSIEVNFWSDLFCRLHNADPVGLIEITKRSNLGNELERDHLWAKDTATEAILRTQTSTADGGQRHLPALTTQFNLFDPQEIFGRFKPLINLLFSRFTLTLMAGLFFVAQVLFWVHSDYWIRGFNKPIYQMLNHIVLATFVNRFSVVAHEFGHALTCYKFGGKVRRMGVILFLGFLPAFFADVSDSYFFRQRNRILVMLAGVLSQLVLWSCGMIVWSVAPSGSYIQLLGLLFCLANGIDILFSIIPVFKLDGYFILSDLLNIDNLYSRSFRYCNSRILQAITGNKAQTTSVPTSREIRWFWLFYFSTIFFLTCELLLTLWLVSIAWAYSIFFPQILYLLMLLALISRMIGYLLRRVPQTNRAHFLRSLYRFRISWKPIVCMLLLGAALMAPIPYRIPAEGTILPLQSTLVRSTGGGSIEEVYVEEGAHVGVGAPLFRISKGGSDLMIRSPDRGIVITPMLHDVAGHSVRKGDPLVLLATGELGIELLISEKKASELRMGLPFRVSLVVTGIPCNGRLIHLSPTYVPRESKEWAFMGMSPPESTVLIKGQIRCPDTSELRLGTRVTATIDAGMKPLIYVLFQPFWLGAVYFIWTNYLF
ncbi:MAG TPA: hypothetical protein VI895_13745 [Bdellovibrionota bacterium]|nr:hypothetical protein [Bdellovibrionota bacterium]